MYIHIECNDEWINIVLGHNKQYQLDDSTPVFSVSLIDYPFSFDHDHFVVNQTEKTGAVKHPLSLQD
jgi:hypothetical protein